MLRRFFLALFILSVSINAAETKPFHTLSSPLFKAAKTLQSVTLPQTLQKNTAVFIEHAQALQNLDLQRQTLKNPNAPKSYLKALRKLQKEYHFILHQIHLLIEHSIAQKDYEKFLFMTSIELDGLLQNRAIQERSLAFYRVHKSKKTSPFLEHLQDEATLLEESNEEVYSEITELQFDSKSAAANRKNSVYVTTKEEAGYLLVSFCNANNYGVTLSVVPRYINLKEHLQKEKIFSLKAKEEKLFAKFSLSQSEGSYSFAYSWIMGEIGVVHDESYLYRLPFERGASYRVSQGHNTDKTHKAHAQYAIDFAMPVGTKIYAAREGVVVRSKSDSNSGGYERRYAKEGNFVTIAHSDGTFATYYHLMQNGVLVKSGEHVSKGSHIGYSGNTGYSSGPHLHFAVFATTSAHTTQTIAVRFSSSQGVFKTPTQGQFYTAN